MRTGADQTGTESEKKGMGILYKLAYNRLYSLSLTVVLLVIASCFLWPKTFANAGNMRAIFLNMSFDAIVSAGMMLLMISGAFDLSVGSVLGATAGFTSLLLLRGYPVVLTIFLGLCVAASFGLINGLIITKIGVNPMITTLAMMSIARGFMLLINNDALALPDSFLVIGQSRFLTIQLPFWFALFVVIVFSILVSKFSFFHRYYYIGGNEKAARLSGIPVDRMKIIAFVLSAVLAGSAGILLTARMGGSMITYGQGMEMRVITASILGGASLKGGVGVIPGAFLGTIFMALLSNLMIIAKVSVYWQQIIIGIILLIAVSVDVLLKKQAE